MPKPDNIPGHFEFQQLPTISLSQWHKKHQNHNIRQFVHYDKDIQGKEIGMIILACRDCQEIYVRDTIK